MMPSVPVAHRRGTVPAAVQDERSRPGIAGTLRVIWSEIRTDFVATMLLLIALVIGFLHGWLKMKYPFTWMTFAFDVPVLAALSVTLAKLPRGTRWFPECGVSTSIKFLLAVCAIWAVLPFPVPWLAAVASSRAWCFSPILFLLGYHLFQTVRKVVLVIWGVLGLALATAVYGIFFQTEAEIREMMKNSPEMQLRLVGNFYATTTGAEFRRFSTFVSSAVFGATMAACTQFAVSRLYLPGCTLIERALLLAITGMCTYAVILSGSRTSLLLLGTSLLMTAIVRRGRLQWLVFPAITAGALYLGVAATKGGAGERFGSLLDSTTVWMRLFIVLGPMWRSLMAAPLGHGVGASGFGVPSVLVPQLREMLRESPGAAEIEGADGDLGRLAIDLGIVGLTAYALLIYHGVRDSLRWMWTLRESRLGVVGVPAGAWFFMSLVQIPTGSPYLGIPFGPLTWIMFGALRRLIDEYDALKVIHGEDGEALPQFASFIQAPKLASLFGTRGPVAAGMPPVLRAASVHRRPGPGPVALVSRPQSLGIGRPDKTPGAGRPAKRFLFPRNRPGGE